MTKLSGGVEETNEKAKALQGLFTDLSSKMDTLDKDAKSFIDILREE